MCGDPDALTVAVIAERDACLGKLSEVEQLRECATEDTVAQCTRPGHALDGGAGENRVATGARFLAAVSWRNEPRPASV
jgi:hypothetical protein